MEANQKFPKETKIHYQKLKNFMKCSNYNLDELEFKKLSPEALKKRVDFYCKYKYEDIYTVFTFDRLIEYLGKLYEIGSKINSVCDTEAQINKFKPFIEVYKESAGEMAMQSVHCFVHVDKYLKKWKKNHLADLEKIENLMKNKPNENLLKESTMPPTITDIVGNFLISLERSKTHMEKYGDILFNLWTEFSDIIKKREVLNSLAEINQKINEIMKKFISTFDRNYNTLTHSEATEILEIMGLVNDIGVVLNNREWEKKDGPRKNNYPHAHQLYLFFQSDREIRKIEYSYGVYEGEVINGNKNGYGVVICNDGQKEEGEFIGKDLNGFAVVYNPNGDISVGTFKNNQRNGFNIYYWSNGNIFEGEWKNSNKHGFGILYFASGKKTIGFWENDKYLDK